MPGLGFHYYLHHPNSEENEIRIKNFTYIFYGIKRINVVCFSFYLWTVCQPDPIK